MPFNDSRAKNNTDFVFDKSGELLMLYSNTKFDKSDEVLEMMGIAGKK